MNYMQKIIPHLWFDKEAKEAVKYYASMFRDSAIQNIATIDGTPSGSVDTVSFRLAEQDFIAISAGPYFTFTLAISFMVECDTVMEVGDYWSKLSRHEQILMELDSYPFSERYGWLNDMYGLSWQLIYMKNRIDAQKIVPSLLFTGQNCGKAEEAMYFYTTVFHNARIISIERFGKDDNPSENEKVKYGSFVIENKRFAIMESGYEHGFTFNEAISFAVNCESQEEIDYYWEKLSAVPEAEQCGWLKDKYGISWQISPTILSKMMASTDREKVKKVTQAFLKMKKFDIAGLKKVYEEE